MDPEFKKLAPRFSKRRTSAMPMRIPQGNTRERRVIMKPGRMQSTNKENEHRGARRNLLEQHTPCYNPSNNKKNGRLPYKEFGPRRSITRRLSFHKNTVSDDSVSLLDLEVAEQSLGKVTKIQKSDKLSSITTKSYLGAGNKDSMSHEIMKSDCSTFSDDVFEESIVKASYSSLHTPCGSLNVVKQISVPKIELSDAAKKILAQMDIKMSPLPQHMKPKYVPKSPAENVNELDYCYKERQTVMTQTEKSLGEGKIEYANILEKVKEVCLRQVKEREELELRHKREMEEFFTQMREDQLPQSQPTQSSSDFLNLSDHREDQIKKSNAFQASADGAACQLTAKSIIPQDQNLVQDLQKEPNQLNAPQSQQKWCYRKQELSFLDSPHSGIWMVGPETDGISSNNTPTLGLNSMLEGMTIDGQQQLMETPATRRLVTRRILQGIESLFN